MTRPVMEVDGEPVSVDALRPLALLNYGHSTAMQIRGGAVRGLELHLHRLRSATEELFGTTLEPETVLHYLRRALARTDGDATVRVYVFASEHVGAVSTLVVVEAPRERSAQPRALRSVAYQRPVPHLKHIGTFGKLYEERRAQADGFDSVLLTDPAGHVVECATTNVGFFDGDRVVWPEGPALQGITMALMERYLVDWGIPSVRRPVHLREVTDFVTAFTANSRGLTPIGRIDDTVLPVDPGAMSSLLTVFDALPWNTI
ncbi:aminotransferase class IV [Streptomyces massasporeus]|uniref:aminotransferase class IV n=1 Tax=Streptomyces massasporeus TaxID=67324 RepID=UPI00365DD6BD